MRRLFYIITLIFLASFAEAQEIQLHGRFFRTQNDTTRITIWSDGDLIGKSATTDSFYSLVLGNRPHYTIKMQSGSKTKYCHIFCQFMEFESIQLDCDFLSSQNVIIYKEKKSSKKYILLFQGPKQSRQMVLEPYETDY